ncbi:MAG: DUF1810 domain-containing protein [Bacilli bacterium]|nr:DUF1810 domain-containing protein [Bacilli bacterium]
MWLIFPQLKSLGKSEMSEYYGISGKNTGLHMVAGHGAFSGIIFLP